MCNHKIIGKILIISLFLLSSNMDLKNNQTKIHKHKTEAFPQNDIEKIGNTLSIKSI